MATGLYSGVSGLALGVGLYKGVSGLWGGASGLINGFGGSGPFPGASLYLDFLTPPLDSRITFTRGTNATLVDNTGRVTYAPANLLLRSEELNVSPWSNVVLGTGSTPTVTADAGVAPDGNTTADRVQFSLGGGTTTNDVSRQTQPFNTPATNHIFSIWLRSFDGVSSINMHLVGPTGGTTNIVVTGAWQRFSVAAVGSGGVVSYAIGLRGGQTPANNNTADVLAWGAQLEPVTYQTVPGPYVATTASAYYGPRFDYDPVTLAPRGLLVEEQRTNLLTRSEQFDNAAWGLAGLTVAANTTVAPSGVTAADTITGSSGSNAVIFPAAGFSASATSYTASCYVKAGSAAWIVLSMWQGSGNLGINVWFNAQTGAVGSNNATAGYVFTSASSTAVGNGWYRITVTGTVPASTVFWSMRIVDGDNAFVYTNTVGDTMFIWGAQLEAGTFATSYIPTVASTVTRSADVATMTGTNFSSWYNQSEGTFIADGTALTENSLAGYWVVNVTPGSNANSMYSAFADTRQLRVFDGAIVEQVSIASSGVTPLVNAKTAAAYKLNDFAVSTNGGTVATDTTGTLPAPTQMQLGFTNGNFNGWIAQLAYYNTRLPNAQLQALTAPSLASPLALDFTTASYTVGY